MIIVEQLSKNYNGTAVLNIAELEIPKGQSFVWWGIMELVRLLFLVCY